MARWIENPVARAATAAVLCTQLSLPAGIATAQQEMSSPAAQMQDNPPQRVPIEAPAATPMSMDTRAVLSGGDTRLNQDAKILLVLNRFTYGPRPGDLEHVRQVGLTQWFREQLNPFSLDDSATEARLAQYPAMNLSLDRMLEQFPSNDAVRRAARSHDAVSEPAGPNRAVFNDRVAAYRERLKAKGEAAEKAKSMSEDNAMDSDKRAKSHAPGKEELPASVDDILAMEPDARFRLICKLDFHQLGELRRQASGQQERLTAGFTPQQMETIAAFAGPAEVVASEEVQSKLLRDIYSERQLQEVMVDFWLNHFNVYMKKSDAAPYYIAQFERDVIRPRALGSFEDLLLATASSPAMLDYLDQSESVGPHSPAAHPYMEHTGVFGRPTFTAPKKGKETGLNENYAREVMELHTVGVDGGYTQKDVTEMARVLTGWTVDKGYLYGRPTRAIFDASKHEPGTKVVMGQTIKDNGLNEGVQMLRWLANSPQCAHFISQKLAVRFVSDNPPKTMVNRMAGVFLETHGNIRQVLAAMVNSPEFFTAATYRTKVKTPQDFVISAIRATGAQVQDPQALAKTMTDLGMPLFGHLTPEGYPMQNEAWNSTTALINRMNFSMALAANRVQGVRTDLDSLLGSSSAAMSPRQKQDDIETRLLHVPVSARTETLIAKETTLPPDEQTAQLNQVSAIRGGVRYSRGGKSKKDRPTMGKTSQLAEVDLQAAMATGLVLGSPEFQRR